MIIIGARKVVSKKEESKRKEIIKQIRIRTWCPRNSVVPSLALPSLGSQILTMLSVPPCAMTHIVSVPVISKSSVRFRTAKHVLALTSVPTNDSRISPVSTSQFRMDRSHEHVHNDRGFSNTHPVTRSVCPSKVNIALPLCSFRVLSSSNFLLLRCAKNFVAATHTGLSFRLNARRNCKMIRFKTS